jgi:SnoaL-like polyketide cyclase
MAQMDELLTTLKYRAHRLNAAVNAHDLNPVGEMYAEDAELTWPGLGSIKGRTAIVGFYATMLGAFPDLQVSITRVIEQENVGALEYVAQGTHRGPLPLAAGELPATNRWLRVGASSIGTVDEHGLIKTQHEYFDQVEILVQLGVMPSPQPGLAAERR